MGDPMTTVSSRQTTIVLTVSRQLGSGGSYIGKAVAQRLGLKYADREILEQAARLLGMDDRDLAGFEERVSSLWMQAARVLFMGPPESPYTPPGPPRVDESEVFEVESRIVREIAEREDAVIVGRGAFYVLRHHPGAVRIFVHAPETWRVQRVMQIYAIHDEAAARALVERSDAQRRKFAERIAGGQLLDPTDFDLCMNTATIGLDDAVNLVAGIVSRRLEARGAKPSP
jgi:CMP/dCMP kinase